MVPLMAIGSIFLFMMVTWLFYLAIMNLKGKYKHMGASAKTLGTILLAVGVFFDFAFNLLVGTVFFLDLPREFLFTARLKRYKYGEYASWRKKLANFFCEEFLDPFDPTGCHCDK